MKRSESARDEGSTNGERITRAYRHVRDPCHVAARSEKVAVEQKHPRARSTSFSALRQDTARILSQRAARTKNERGTCAYLLACLNLRCLSCKEAKKSVR